MLPIKGSHFCKPPSTCYIQWSFGCRISRLELWLPGVGLRVPPLWLFPNVEMRFIYLKGPNKHTCQKLATANQGFVLDGLGAQ